MLGSVWHILDRPSFRRMNIECGVSRGVRPHSKKNPRFLRQTKHGLKLPCTGPQSEMRTRVVANALEVAQKVVIGFTLLRKPIRTENEEIFRNRVSEPVCTPHEHSAKRLDQREEPSQSN